MYVYIYICIYRCLPLYIPILTYHPLYPLRDRREGVHSQGGPEIDADVDAGKGDWMMKIMMKSC